MRHKTIIRGLAIVAVVLSLTTPVTAATQHQPQTEVEKTVVQTQVDKRIQQVDPPDENETFPTGNNSNGSVNYGDGREIFPSPADLVEGGLSYLIGQGADAANSGINYLAKIISGMPAPGTYDDPSSWVNPQDGLWPAVWDMTKWTTTLACLLTVGSGMLAFRHNDPYERRDALKTVGISFGMILMTWFIAPLGLHAGGRTALWFAPSGTELLATPGSIAKLISGPLLAFILVKFYLAAVIGGMIALVAQYVLAHLVVVFWPLAWALRPFGGTMRSAGDYWIYLYGLLIALNVFQAIILRTLFELPWGAGQLGPVTAIIATFVGLAIALVYVPYKGLNKASQAASIGLGISSMKQASGKHIESANQKVGNVRDRYNSLRGEEEGEGGKSAPTSGGMPDAGSPGVSSANASSSVKQRRRTGSFGSSSQPSPTGDRSRRGMYADTDSNRERSKIDNQNDRMYQ